MEEKLNQAAAPENRSATASETAPKTAAAQPKKVRRVGTFAFGLILVAAGVLLVAHNFMPELDLVSIVKFAPAVLVVLGVEVLIYAARPDVTLKYDFLSMFACAFILLCVGGASLLNVYIAYYGPSEGILSNQVRRQVEEQAYTAVRQVPGTQNLIRDASFNVYNYRRVEADGTIQPSDDLDAYAYFTFNPGFESEEDFAAACKTVMDACGAADVPITEYRFDIWHGDGQEAPIAVYELSVSGRWLADADLETLVRNVSVSWWYQDISFTARADLDDYLAQQTAETEAEDVNENLANAYEEGYQTGVRLAADMSSEELVELLEAWDNEETPD